MGPLSTASRYHGPERRSARPSRPVLIAAGLAVAAIAYATLCPIGLRPHLASANLERFGAYFVLGLIIIQAAPRRGMVVIALIVALAFGLEAAQLFIPGRDGRFTDACIKAAGGVVGAQLGLLRFAVQRNVPRLVAAVRAAQARPVIRQV